MGERLVRISVTLPQHLAAALDELSSTAFRSRSQAVAEAVRLLLEAYSEEPRGPVMGVIIYRYSGHAAEELRGLGHRYLDTIVSTLHVHVGEDECMEVLVVRGDGGRVKQLVRELTGVRGVAWVRRFLVPQALSGGRS